MLATMDGTSQVVTRTSYMVCNRATYPAPPRLHFVNQAELPTGHLKKGI